MARGKNLEPDSHADEAALQAVDDIGRNHAILNLEAAPSTESERHHSEREVAFVLVHEVSVER